MDREGFLETEKLKDLLAECEYLLDYYNGELGEPCLYCFGEEYTGKDGIVHEEDCLIKRIRKEIGSKKII